MPTSYFRPVLSLPTIEKLITLTFIVMVELKFLKTPFYRFLWITRFLIVKYRNIMNNLIYEFYFFLKQVNFANVATIVKTFFRIKIVPLKAYHCWNYNIISQISNTSCTNVKTFNIVLLYFSLRVSFNSREKKIR